MDHLLESWNTFEKELEKEATQRIENLTKRVRIIIGTTQKNIPDRPVLECLFHVRSYCLMSLSFRGLTDTSSYRIFFCCLR